MTAMSTKQAQMSPGFMTRVAPPEEIADVAVFLSCPASVGINGQNILVDRGLRERLDPMAGVFEVVNPVPI